MENQESRRRPGLTSGKKTGRRMEHPELEKRLSFGRVEERGRGKICGRVPDTSCRGAGGQELIAAVVLPQRNLT